VKRLLGPLAILPLLVFAAPASAAGGPLGLDDCQTTHGTYQCTGLVETWDGVPLDTTMTLPDAGARHLPLVAEIHGFGNSKYEYLDPASTAYTDNAFAWAKDGYAVLTYTARGLWGSCGTTDSRAANPGPCAKGYIHLADVRYEVRDTQELIGRLVDEGYAAQDRIGVTGDSYGGGQSLMLAALRNRTMLPDGELVPWRSPAGKPLEIAAAAPVIPWSDLITAAAPNGRVSAYGITGRRRATSPVGVVKTTFVNAIFLAAQFATGPGQPLGEPFVPGRPMGYLAPPAADPDADITSVVVRTDRGEPYTDPEARGIVHDLTRYHSAYYIDPSVKPPPLLLSSGFTDDLFPVDEVLRFANRTRALYPDSPVSLLLGDFGHQRAANKPAERERMLRDIHRWFDHYLLGSGRQPREGATAYLQTCPKDRASIGPFHAPTFARLARRRIGSGFRKPRVVTSDGGDPAVGKALDPVAGGGDSCAVTPSDKADGTARYRLRTVKRRPISLLGAPKLSAKLEVDGVGPGVAQLDARLWDVDPDGQSQRLIARGTYRPKNGHNRWQLHPAAWRVERGHELELELLGNDAPYARPSNGDFEVTVSDLRVRLPAR
jgi:dienelactone hydrolase